MRKHTHFKIICAALGLFLVGSCAHPRSPIGEDYWQRIEAHSALYLTGPKAQQQLEEDISTCVAVIKELVELEATREVLPPDAKHQDYLETVKSDDQLAHWETPKRRGAHMVDHSDFHDFEGCMRSKGWERVNYVRPQTKRHARKVYKTTQKIRKHGPDYQEKEAQAVREREEKADFSNLNN